MYSWEFPHVCVEACDSCGRYIKAVDLTVDGRAVPLVDEIATLPLNIWAEEHGYSKIRSEHREQAANVLVGRPVLPAASGISHRGSRQERPPTRQLNFAMLPT